MASFSKEYYKNVKKKWSFFQHLLILLTIEFSGGKKGSLEEWPSGLRRRSWKPLYESTVGSNPTSSAKNKNFAVVFWLQIFYDQKLEVVGRSNKVLGSDCP